MHKDMSQTLKAAKGQKDEIKDSKEITLSSSYFTNPRSSWQTLSRETQPWMSKQDPQKEVDSLKQREAKAPEIHATQETINKKIDISDGK